MMLEIIPHSHTTWFSNLIPVSESDKHSQLYNNNNFNKLLRGECTKVVTFYIINYVLIYLAIFYFKIGKYITSYTIIPLKTLY